MKKRILLTRNLHYLPGADEALRKEVEVIQSPGIKENDLLPLLPNVHGIIAIDTAITENIIRSAPLLQVISTPQVGFDKIDVEAATKAGIPVMASLGLSTTAVAEFTLGLMLDLARRITRSNCELRQKKNWAVRATYSNPDLQMGVDLQGSTIGLIGLGAIGSGVARLCKAAFSARILAYDPFISKERMAAQGIEKRDSLADMAGEVDVLSLHMALTEATRHLIGEAILRAMKPGAYLINCARGAVVDEKALVKALQEKWIAGAATDVFEEEPVKPDNPLLTMENVIVTPHIAGVTLQSCATRGQEMVKRLVDVLEGNRAEGIVNPEVWPAYIKRLITLK